MWVSFTITVVTKQWNMSSDSTTRSRRFLVQWSIIFGSLPLLMSDNLISLIQQFSGPPQTTINLLSSLFLVDVRLTTHTWILTLVKIENQNMTFKRLCDNNFSKPIHGQIQGIEDLLKPTHIFLRDELFCWGRVPLSVLFPRNLKFDKTKTSFIYHIWQ
jgi:hypothetical protein